MTKTGDEWTHVTVLWPCVRSVEVRGTVVTRIGTSYFFNNDAYFLDFLYTKLLFDNYNLNPFKHQQVQHLGF